MAWTSLAASVLRGAQASSWPPAARQARSARMDSTRTRLPQPLQRGQRLGSSLFGVGSDARGCSQKAPPCPSITQRGRWKDICGTGSALSGERLGDHSARRQPPQHPAAKAGWIFHLGGGFSRPPPGSSQDDHRQVPTLGGSGTPHCQRLPRAVGAVSRHRCGRFFSNGRRRGPNGRLGCPGHAVKHLSWPRPRTICLSHPQETGN